MKDKKITTTITTGCDHLHEDDREHDGYDEFSASIQSFFDLKVNKDTPLFTTNVGKLFDIFLANLPASARQHYTCDSCRHFVKHFGGLVTINDDGQISSILWNEDTTPEFFGKSVKAMNAAILKSKVNGILLSHEHVWGHPTTGDGEWSHMSVVTPPGLAYVDDLLSASQAMAKKAEEFRMVKTSMLKYTDETLDSALMMLKTNSLPRSEKCVGVAEWLRTLRSNMNNTKNRANKVNMTWLAVATAPEGYCHINSNMIGTLLDDISAGLTFESIKNKFADKVKATQYQRPTAPPSLSNIVQAEKIFEIKGIQTALERRFAQIEEIPAKLWVPKEQVLAETKVNGVFGHLVPKETKVQTPLVMPAIPMTWRTFKDTVIPVANKIEFLVNNGIDAFSAMLTSVHADAKPIFQWDTEEKRNPFSCYTYTEGTHAFQWGLRVGYCNVTTICYQPSMWDDQYVHQGKSVMFTLEGAKDSGYDKGVGNALFPENLKSYLHDIRSTIAAYSSKALISNYENATACGIQFGPKSVSTFRVTTDLGVAVYKLDRWE